MTAPKNREQLVTAIARIIDGKNDFDWNACVENANAILAALEEAGCAVVPVKMTDAWRVNAQEWADDGNADLYNYPLEDGFRAMLAASPYRNGG